MRNTIRSRKGALSNIVWAMIGMLMAAVLGAIVYVVVMHGLGANGQLTVNAYTVGNSKIIVDLKNIGTGTVTIQSVQVLDYQGNTLKCSVETASLRGGTVTLPVTLKPGDTLTITMTGTACVNAYRIIVQTTTGTQIGYVQG